MRIIIVGATGTIGSKLTEELGQRHEIVKASRNSGDVKVDITSRTSIENMYRQVGKFDAVINVAGGAYFGPFEEMGEEQLYQGIRDKMMGQINLVMVGKDFINDNGSFTLTTGILSEDPIPNGAALSMVNGAVNAFVMAAALELKRGIRLNAISPGLVENSYEALGAYFPGHIPVPMDKVVKTYLKSVEGILNGEVIKIY